MYFKRAFLVCQLTIIQLLQTKTNYIILLLAIVSKYKKTIANIDLVSPLLVLIYLLDTVEVMKD